jgi:ATP-dependent protease ClpP protease subunit
MKKALSFLTALVLSFSATAFSFPLEQKKNLPKTAQEIELDTANLVVFRGEVNEKSTSKVIRDIESSNSDEIILYIVSPGGSVISGSRLISYLRASPKKITCVVDIAISMAFVTLQACDERIATPSSIAMQHVTTYGINQQPAPNAVSFQNFIEKMAVDMDNAQAKRIGLSYKEFKTRTRDDWWLFGEELTKSHVTDRTTKVTCSKRAINTVTEEVVETLFGSVNVSWSSCPMITSPVKVDFSRFYGTPKDVIDFSQKLDIRQSYISKIEQ